MIAWGSGVRYEGQEQPECVTRPRDIIERKRAAENTKRKKQQLKRVKEIMETTEWKEVASG